MPLSMSEPASLSAFTLLRLLLIRIASISLYLCAYRNIDKITRAVINFTQHPLVLVLVVTQTETLISLKEPFLKTFTLLTIFSTTLVPIIRTLLAEIDTDAAFFLFFVCQIIFCIDSTRTSILNRTTTKRRFHKDEVISLEESILIPTSTRPNCIVGNIAALLGFFGTFSRIEDDTQVLVLQGIGYAVYLLVPHVLEKRLIHLSSRRLALILSSFLVVQLLFDRERVQLFLTVVAFVMVFWTLCIKLIEIRMEK